MFTNLLNQTCEVQKKTETQNSLGEIIEVWATHQIIPCRLSTKREASEQSNQLYGTITRAFLLFVEKSANIERKDRVVLQGEIYQVLDVHSYNNNTTTHHKQVDIVCKYN